MKFVKRIFAASVLMVVVAQSHANDTRELAKASQNPVGNIISLPFEYNYDFEVGPEEGDVQILNLKPVYPLNIGKYNLINRFTVPLSHSIFHQLQLSQRLVSDKHANEYRQLGREQLRLFHHSNWRRHRQAGAVWQTTGRFQAAGLLQRGEA